MEDTTGSKKPTRQIFVIMLFSRTPSRTKDELDEFFRINLKRRIEDESTFRFLFPLDGTARAQRRQNSNAEEEDRHGSLCDPRDDGLVLCHDCLAQPCRIGRIAS